MNNSEQYLKKPSPGQLRLLRELAVERGVSFAYPHTWDQAATEIRKLKGRERTPHTQRRREVRAVQDAMARRGDAASVRAEELAGYGSTATWAKTVEDDTP